MHGGAAIRTHIGVGEGGCDDAEGGNESQEDGGDGETHGDFNGDGGLKAADLLWVGGVEYLVVIHGADG